MTSFLRNGLIWRPGLIIGIEFETGDVYSAGDLVEDEYGTLLGVYATLTGVYVPEEIGV